jgi:hypothetical protein
VTGIVECMTLPERIRKKDLPKLSKMFSDWLKL